MTLHKPMFLDTAKTPLQHGLSAYMYTHTHIYIYVTRFQELHEYSNDQYRRNKSKAKNHQQ
jgi:hypothetical protein